MRQAGTTRRARPIARQTIGDGPCAGSDRGWASKQTSCLIILLQNGRNVSVLFSRALASKLGHRLPDAIPMRIELQGPLVTFQCFFQMAQVQVTVPHAGP